MRRKDQGRQAGQSQTLFVQRRFDRTASMKLLVPKSESGGSGSGADKSTSSAAATGAGGPSGGLMARLRRWNIINKSEDCEPEDGAGIGSGEAGKGPAKTGDTKALLFKALKGNYLFSELPDADLESTAAAMKRVAKQPGDIIIRQGHKGSEFFILEKGHADIFVNDEKVGEYGPGGCFGELALIYNAKRAATITATAACTLWSLDLRTFRRTLATASASQAVARIEFLRKVPLLRDLSNEQVTKLAGALSNQQFQDGEHIIRQGEMGNTFYLLKEGSVKCSQTKAERQVELLRLGPGDYFGEMALLLEEPRHADVVAVGHVEVLALEKGAFTQLLGPVRDVLSRQMRTRVLKSVPVLATLSDADLDLVGNAMRVQQFEPGQYIVKEGEPGTRFYIVNEGEVKCVRQKAEAAADGKAAGEGQEEELLRLKDQDYFGERSLLTDEPRAASVVAVTLVECLVLERQDFCALLGGDLGQVLAEEAKRREDVAAVAKGAAAIEKVELPCPKLKMEEFNILRTLGTGTFGRVKLVQHLPTNSVGALKCMQKAQIVSCHQERNIMNEKNILASCSHPFILQLLGTLKDKDQVYMLMELVQGGELWVYIYDRFDALPRTKAGGFRPEDARFYAANIVSALAYIHGKGVAYRDLKPENLLLSARGYLKVIDFGFAKQIPFYKNNQLQPKSFTLCGTPEYLAPELVLSRGHDKSVDFWALGCLLYELLVGHTPFQDEQQDEIFKKILHSQKHLAFPRGLDQDAADLIRKLLNPNAAFRLGNLLDGPKDVMQHAFFAGLDWAALKEMAIPAPYQPTVRDPMDVSNFDPYPDDEEVVPYAGPQDAFEQF